MSRTHRFFGSKLAREGTMFALKSYVIKNKHSFLKIGCFDSNIGPI